MAVLQKLEKIYNLLLNGPVKVLGTVSGTIHGTAAAADYDYNGNKISTYYQEKLVSGTNIKTINGQSLLAPKDILASPILAVELSSKTNEYIGTLEYKQKAESVLKISEYSNGAKYHTDFLSLFDSYIVLYCVAETDGGSFQFSVNNLLLSSSQSTGKTIFNYEINGLWTLLPEGVTRIINKLTFYCIAK